jgi:hypothetical protein
VRALPVAVTLMDQARARKHDTDLGNRLTDPASGLLGRDAVLTVIGLQNAGKYLTAARLRGSRSPAWPGRGTPGSAP